MLRNLLRASMLWAAVWVVWAVPAFAQDYDPDLLGTYSIIARDPATGELGMGVQSKAFAVGNRVAGAKGGVGVIAHQAVSNPMYSYLGLPLLEAGMSPQEALDQMVLGDEGRARRQVAILDMEGRSASWTGPNCTDWKGHHCGTNYCAQGNTLAGPEVLDAMVKSFESSGTSGNVPLAERLLAALERALAARDKSPRNDNAWVMLGAVYLKMNRRANAMAAVERAIELNPAREYSLTRDPNFEALYIR